MFELNDALEKFALDSENPELNYKLGLIYEDMGQTAAAISFYLRASERTTIVEHAYECLLRMGNCFNKQGNRKNTVQKTYKQALALLPNRPEAYLCLAKFFEVNEGNSDSYIFADLGLKMANFELPPLRTNVCEPLTDVYSGLLLEKAICSWGWGKNQETRDLFSLIYNEHYDKFNDAYKTIIRNNMTKMKLIKNKIIDCFRFFNERELLELRYNMLKDKVDKFIILEGTKTHSGLPWQPLAKKYISELGYPLEKFEFIETDLPGNDEDIENNEVDITYRSYSGESNDTYKNSLNARTRERLTLDSLLTVMNNYTDDDVFMVSDCDEIIRPDIIEHFSNMASKYPNHLIKVPLDELQGSVNLQLYSAGELKPIVVDNVFFICTKKHFDRATPFQLRTNTKNPYEVVYVTQDGKRVQDCGWHFSWMGDAARKNLKIRSTSHYADKIVTGIIPDMNSSAMHDFIDNWQPSVNGLNPYGDKKFILKEYPRSKLPKEIFELTHLTSFFLNEANNNMAHENQRTFIKNIKNIFPTYFSDKAVLDIGSLDINGSMRDFFENCNYVGIDIGPGKGVDIVCEAQKYDAPDNSYDVVCSAECFEHNPYWFETFENMIRLCKPGGLLFFTCATEGRPEHGTVNTGAEASPLTVAKGWDYYKNLVETDFTNKLNFHQYFEEWKFEVHEEAKDLYFWGKVNQKAIVRKNKNLVIDYFPFFAPYGEELLELRVSVLKDHVDYFVISESNKTHAGAPTERKFLEIARKLNLPMNKIIYYPLDIPEDNDLVVEQIDILNTYQNYTWTPDSEKIENRRARVRERLQKDAILHVLNKFDDNDVVIHSDSDEIIDPRHISYLAECCRAHQTHILKVPLMLCEAQADLRVYWKNGNHPVDWSGGMFFATVSQLKKATPTQIRSNNLNPFPISYITENNLIVQDLGWHFSWMGGKRERKIKVSNFTHHNDKFSWMKGTFESYADEKFLEWSDETEFKDGSISPTGNPNFILRKISHDLLPKALFENDRLKAYFLKESKKFHFISKKAKNTLWIVDNFYETPDDVRKFALEQEYVEGGFGRGFIGRRTVNSFLFEGLKDRFEEIIGKKITGWTSEDNPEKYGMNGRFQIAWAGEPLVYHCDNQRWGGMLYLTPGAPYQCGTTLYAHKQTRARTYYDPGWDAAWNHPGGSHLDGTPWEPVDIAGNVYNRLVIFDASAIHAASEYFGSTKENARLWQMFFFDTD